MCVRLFIFGLPLLVCLIIACGTIGGFVQNTKLNRLLVETNCTAAFTYSKQYSCSYTCNCDSNGKNCGTCHKPCFYGFLIGYVPPLSVYSNPVTIVGPLDTALQVDTIDKFRFPTNSSFACFYFPPLGPVISIDILLSRYEETAIFIASMVFFGFSACIAIAWLIVEFCICGEQFMYVTLLR